MRMEKKLYEQITTILFSEKKGELVTGGRNGLKFFKIQSINNI